MHPSTWPPLTLGLNWLDAPIQPTPSPRQNGERANSSFFWPLSQWQQRWERPLPVPLRGEGGGGIGDEPIRAEGEGQPLVMADSASRHGVDFQ
jgi:hypothetical protein